MPASPERCVSPGSFNESPQRHLLLSPCVMPASTAAADTACCPSLPAGRPPREPASPKSPAEAVMAEIRAKVQVDTRLTCSAGCAPNAMLAKILSDINKPDGACP